MPNTPEPIEKKCSELRRILGACRSLAVAFSGGVDSTVLLAVAQQQLGEHVVAMTARSPLHSRHETEQAVKLAHKLGVRHLVFDPDVMSDADIVANGAQRCYYCKRRIFRSMAEAARKIGIDRLAHGENADDIREYRPGSKAAAESGVSAPLVEAGLNKSEIRCLARKMGLSNWDQPAMACLATRVPYGTPITETMLGRIDAAEAALRDLGVGYARVRVHGSIARIEAPAERIEYLARLPMRHAVASALRALDFQYVCLDLEGYVSGSMDRSLDEATGARPTPI
jgi:uncharacterized protein